MMRDIHIVADLRFDTPEYRDDSEDIIMRILGLNCRLNAQFLKLNPDTPTLYSSGVVYTPPDQADGRPPLRKGDVKDLLALIRKMGADPETALMVVRMMKGIEIFMGLSVLYKRGKGDCNELVPVRVAELWRAGIAASPYLIKGEANARGGTSYHAAVLWPDGSIEDPSRVLGMGDPDGRREEIRKNIERWDNYMFAAKRLIQAEGGNPDDLGKKIEAMGLVPRDGVFKSPYKDAA